MIVSLARHNLEEDDYRRVERTNRAQLEILSGVEHEPVRPGSQRRVGSHQRPQTSVRVGVPAAHELPLTGVPAAIEHDVYACGRTPERCIENVSRDRAQAKQLYSVDIQRTLRSACPSGSAANRPSRSTVAPRTSVVTTRPRRRRPA